MIELLAQGEVNYNSQKMYALLLPKVTLLVSTDTMSLFAQVCLALRVPVPQVDADRLQL